MKFRLLLPILAGLFLIMPRISRSQQFSDEERSQFSAHITVIKFWSYLSGDSTYKGFPEMSELVRSAISRKGYLAEEVEFSPGLLKSASKWEQELISRLDSNEAFLILVLLPVSDSSNLGGQPISHMNVVDPSSGTTIVNTRQSQPGNEAVNTLFFHSEILIFTKGFPDQSGKYSPALMKINQRDHPDPRESATTLLNKIPRHEGAISGQTETSAFSSYTAKGEFSFLGGYLFPSTMDVTGGIADFSGSPVYGVEVALGFSRNLDLAASFFRQSSHYELHSTKAKEIDNPLPVSLNYVLMGCNYNFRMNRTWTLFLGGLVGGVNIVQENRIYRDVWYFSLSAQGGLKIYFLPWLGLRLQAQTLYQVHPDAAPFLYSKDGTLFPIDAYSNMLQFGISGGVFFRAGGGRRW
jgi:hypothetical protein